MKLSYLFWRTFSEFFGDIKLSWKPLFISWKPECHKFKDNHLHSNYSEFVNMVLSGEIRPGDIIFTRSNGYLSTIAIPGEFSHAALYVGKTNKGDYRVIHAVRYGVVDESIWSLARTDEFVIIRPNNVNLKDIKSVIKKAKDYLKKDVYYDYFFSFTNDHRLCCTELVFNCYKDFKDKFNMKLKDRFVINKLKTVPTIVADDFFKFDVKLIFANEYALKKAEKLLYENR